MNTEQLLHINTIPLANKFIEYCTIAYIKKPMPDGVFPASICIIDGEIKYSNQATLDAYTFFEIGWNAALGKPQQVLE